MSKAKNNSRLTGILLLVGTHLIWGFQPLFFALEDRIDTVPLLAYRIVWVFLLCLLMLKIRGLIPQLFAAIKNKEVMKRELPAAFFLLADWSIYLIAVRSGHVMEAAMGYYLMPFVMILLGVLVFHEKIRLYQVAALLLIVIGIYFSSTGFGSVPWFTMSLCLAFAIYTVLKKRLALDSMVSLVIETMIMLPFALVYLLFFAPASCGVLQLSLPQHLFIIGTGIITGLPMLLFSTGIKQVSMADAGILEYLSPSFALISGVMLGEKFTKEKLISFAFIWAGIIVYLYFEYRRLDRQKNNRKV